LFRPLNIFSFYLELYKINRRNLIRTSKFKCSFRWRCHVSFKVLTRISRMILQIFDVPSHFQESPVWNYFDFLFEDMGYSCINMKKYLVCQTIDYMQMSYDYEYKELSIPFWSTCLSSPLKYFMGVWSFVIVYFQQNKSLLKCTSLWQLLFFILYWLHN
jgi:hypothetical protein